MGYLTNAIKALFTRNTTNAASVSGARIPIVEQNGNPIGNDSMSNLAAVLGGLNRTMLKAYYLSNKGVVDLVKRVVEDFPSKSNFMVYGPCLLNVQGFYMIEIYNTDDKTDGLPRYASGYVCNIEGFYVFKCSNYTFSVESLKTW